MLDTPRPRADIKVEEIKRDQSKNQTSPACRTKSMKEENYLLFILAIKVAALMGFFAFLWWFFTQ